MRHGVGGFTEGDELASGVGQVGKLEGRLCAELAEFGECLFGLGRIANHRGEGDLGLFEVGRSGDGFGADPHGGSSTRQRGSDGRLECGSRHAESLLQGSGTTFAEPRQPGPTHLCHALCRCPDQFGGTSHGTLQRGNVSSKGDGQGTHGPGAESTGGPLTQLFASFESSFGL